MPKTSYRAVEETKNKMLAYLAECSDSRQPAQVSIDAMAADLGLTRHRVIHARDELLLEGCVQTIPQYSEMGARIPNGYRITPFGRARLRKARLEATSLAGVEGSPRCRK